MSLLDKAKNAAQTTKLKGEIALLDRDVKAKKQKFGVELSDLLWDVQAKQNAIGGVGNSKYLKSLQPQWDVARKDLQEIRQKQEDIKAKMAADKQRDDSAKKPSVMDQAKAAGTEAKRRTQLQLLERELQGRKEQFGIDVYDVAVKVYGSTTSAAAGSATTLTDSKNQASASVTNALDSTKKLSFIEKQFAKAAINQISSQLNKLTVTDQDVAKCIGTAKEKVEAIQARIDAKRAEMENLKKQ